MSTEKAYLRLHGNAVQLIVDGSPFIVLGGELGNSSAACASDIETNFTRLRKMGLNTVLVPAYWDLTEPVEGQFDFTLTDKVLEEARANDLKVIFLWFGAWKNSMSCYAPLWFKQDYEKYPRAYTKEGKPLEIASSFSENVFQADNKAFQVWLQHVAEKDRDYGTVIMIQIENEIGMLEDARDHSEVADRHFNSPVDLSHNTPFCNIFHNRPTQKNQECYGNIYLCAVFSFTGPEHVNTANHSLHHNF